MFAGGGLFIHLKVVSKSVTNYLTVRLVILEIWSATGIQIRLDGDEVGNLVCHRFLSRENLFIDFEGLILMTSRLERQFVIHILHSRFPFNQVND